MIRPRAAVGCLVALLVLTSGCNIITAIGYFFRPRQIQKPEYEFDVPSRVAVVIDTARSRDENPVFNRALHERVGEMLREGGSRATLLPLRAVADLRQTNPDFESWSLQKIGSTLDADYVLYIRLDQLVIRESLEYPLLTPAVSLRMKLIGVNLPSAHARVWPEEEKQGRLVSCARQSAQAADSDPDAVDLEARKLGYDTAYYVSMPFIEVDLEERPPVER